MKGKVKLIPVNSLMNWNEIMDKVIENRGKVVENPIENGASEMAKCNPEIQPETAKEEPETDKQEDEELDPFEEEKEDPNPSGKHPKPDPRPVNLPSSFTCSLVMTSFDTTVYYFSK